MDEKGTFVPKHAVIRNICLYDERQYCKDKTDVVESIGPSQYSIHVGTSSGITSRPSAANTSAGVHT